MDHIDVILLKIDDKLAEEELSDNNYALLEDLNKSIEDTSHLKSEIEKIANVIFLSDTNYIEKNVLLTFHSNKNFFDTTCEDFISQLQQDRHVAMNNLRQKVSNEIKQNIKVEFLAKKELDKEKLTEKIILFLINNSIGIGSEEIDQIYTFALKNWIDDDSISIFVDKMCNDWAILENFEMDMFSLLDQSNISENELINSFRFFCDELDEEKYTEYQLRSNLHSMLFNMVRLYDAISQLFIDIQNTKGQNFDNYVKELKNKALENLNKVKEEKSEKDNKLQKLNLYKFSDYSQKLVDNFRDDKNSIQTLYKMIYGRDLNHIRNYVDTYVKGKVTEQLSSDLIIFVNKRSQVLGTKVNSFFIKELSLELKKDFSTIGFNFVINEMIKYHNTMTKTMSYSSHFKNQKDFIRNQEYYLKKICKFLSVDRSKIMLTATVKQDNLKRLGGSFNEAFAMNKGNGIYEISFSRLSGYVTNGRDYSKESLIRAMLHELTHVKQYESGRLKYVASDVMWEGRIFTKQLKEAENSHQDYLNLPWEIEARASEKYAQEILEKYPNVKDYSEMIDKLTSLFKLK